MIIFDVQNGGITARLLELPVITKEDGRIFVKEQSDPDEAVKMKGGEDKWQDTRE